MAQRRNPSSRPSNRPCATLERVFKNVCEKHGRVCIDPDKNILIGWTAIRAYLGIRSQKSLRRLIDDHGLPVMLRLDGRHMTSCTQIDWWLQLQSEIQKELKDVARKSE